MDTLLFCYANNEERPLTTLKDEEVGIDALLDRRAAQNHFRKERDPYATTESVAQKILTYRDSLRLFHFSGHAGDTILQLEDGQARGAGIAQLLAQCPNLRLVFLNGCSTLGHLKLLAEQGVKAAVIATSTPINDQVAARFALNFYGALNYQKPLRDALDEAMKKLQVAEDTKLQSLTDRGGLVQADLPEVSRNQWYFFCPDEETARWELPTGEAADTAGYKPNVALRVALFTALRAYDSSLTEQFKAKQTLPPDALKSWLNEEVMRRLPFPLSEPLRKLLCPAISREGKLLPVESTRDRLVNYVSLFESGVDLLVVTMLAQVLDRLLRAHDDGQPLTPDPEMVGQLQRLLTDGWSDLDPPALATAFRILRRFLDETGTALFVSEIRELANQFEEKAPFYDSVRFFDDLRRRLASPAGVANVPALCQVGEDHLVELSKRLGFWANYQLESYKNIRVVRFFHRPPEYKHERVVLRTSQSYREDEKYFQEVALKELWECQSVLLVKNPVQNGVAGPEPVAFLNLSPLLIDRNAFLKSDNTVFDLYNFHSVQASGFRFRHVARPEDALLIIGPDDGELLHQQDFTVLREQINALRGLFQVPGEAATAVPASDGLDLSALSLPD